MARSVNRRDFLTQSGRTAAGVAGTAIVVAQPGRTRAQPAGANNRIGVALIGCGGMGQYDLRDFLRSDEVRCVALCDVDSSRFGDNQAMRHVNEHKPDDPKPEFVKDYRRVLDMKAVDAVIVGTPDHWHCLPVAEAFQAGKDVYHEKPVALTIAEGRHMANMARKHGRISQVGTQQRSGVHFQQAVAIVRSGQLGVISKCEVWICDNLTPDGMGTPEDSDPPATVDYDFWLGPAPKRRFNRNRFHGQFRWFWAYAGGKITDWGVHLIDVIHWAMDCDTPLAASAAGGKYALTDNRETPDTMDVLYDYPPCRLAPQGFTLQWTHRSGNSQTMEQRDHCMVFHGSEATLMVDRGRWKVFPQTRRQGRERVDRVPAAESKREDANGGRRHRAHVLNFLECIKTRKPCICPAETGHRSTIPPHLGNIALWSQRKIRWDPYREQIVGDADAARHLVRPYRPPWKLPEIQMGRPIPDPEQT